jgi:DNA helicase-2/ATP-dependent DNA helicase PcrA
MVDEYQDTNYTQYQLVQLLAGQRKNLCVVGDDDQSIYGWRGANLGNILNFEHDFPGAHVVRLEQNYRSCRNILHAANSVIKHNKKRMKKTLWSAKKEGSKINIFLAEDADDEAQWVADRIELLKFEQNISYNDIAIIYRTNLFSRPFEEALRRKRIPYSVIGGMSYFDHREIKDLAAYLKICANPCDDISLLRIVNIPKRGLGPGSIRKLTAFAKDQKITLLDACRHANEISDLAEQPRKNAAKLAHLIDHFTGQFATNKGMGATFRSLINEINYRDHLHELYKNPQTLIKRIDDYEDFISSLAKYEDSNSSPTLHGFLETIALSDMVEPKEDKSSYGVTLISIHSSKGLEYPIVFIVGVEEGILPHKKSASDIEEERRLFYVGITRAMSELYITHTSHRTKYGKVDPSTPSRFLEEISLEITRKLNRFTDDETEDTDATADKFFAHIQKLLG